MADVSTAAQLVSSAAAWLPAAAAVLAVLLAALGVLAVEGYFRPPWHLPTHSPHVPLTRKNLPVAWGRVVSDPMAEFGVPFERVELPGPAGLVLRGWFVDGRPGSRTALVLVHGAGRDRRAWLRHVPVFRRSGFPLLMFDCSGHGASDGAGLGVSFCRRESLDVLAAVRYMREARGFERVALVGTSQGAASSLIAAGAAGPEKVAAVVAENPYYDAHMLASHVLHMVRGRFLPRPLAVALAPLWPYWVTVVSVAVRWRLRRLHGSVPTPGDASEDAAALLDEAMAAGDGTLHPANAIGRVRQPLLVMHSENDFLVPVEHSRLVHAAAKAAAHRDLWIVKGGDHCALYDAYPDEWERRVVGFLNQFAPRA